MCEYCEEDSKHLYSDWESIVYIDNHFMWFKNADKVCLPIHYCPMCGKKLEAQDDTE